ncbi:MAG: hypothetical protein ACTSRG_19220 [Candidatus Helarchaeota archaeon]
MQRYRGILTEPPNFLFTVLINAEINPNYAFVYYLGDKFFNFIPLTQEQKNMLELIVPTIEKDWLSALEVIFVIPTQKTFTNWVKKYKKMYKIIGKAVKKAPEDPETLYKPQVEKFIEKFGSETDLLNDIKPLYNVVENLNQVVKAGLKNKINKIKFKPSIGQKTLAAMADGFHAVKLNIEPIYVLPLGHRSLILTYIPLSSIVKKMFVYYQDIYLVAKDIVECLNRDIEPIIK